MIARAMENCIYYGGMGFVCLAMLALVTVVPFGIYADMKAERFSLRKDQWVCTAKHIETSMIPVQSGNTTTFVPHNTDVCDQWSARK